MKTERIPIFPLQLVLFPQIPLPLHIFEERYRVMIRRCMDGQKRFGVVCQDGNRIEGAGCRTKIEQVLREYDDGQMDILTVGDRRFRILQVFDDEPYLEAEVAYFDDDAVDSDTLEPLAASGVEVIAELAGVAGQEVDREVIDSLRAADLSFVMANIDSFSLREKQRFLELTSTEERLSVCIDGVRETIRRIRAAGNLRSLLDADDLRNMMN